MLTAQQTSLAALVLIGASLAGPTLAVPLNPLAYASLGLLNLGTGQYTLQTDGDAPTLRDAGSNLLATG